MEKKSKPKAPKVHAKPNGPKGHVVPRGTKGHPAPKSPRQKGGLTKKGY